HLDHAKLTQLEFSHQLHADGPAGRSKPHLIEQLAPDQPEIAIDIPQPYPKNPTRETIVDIPDHDPPPRIVALELVPVHQPHAGRHQIQQLRQLADIVLPVTVSVKNKVLPRRRETAPQRRAVSEILRMRDYPERSSMAPPKSREHVRCVVEATV